MSEGSGPGSSRWRHFLMMVPFFLIGVAIPVYFFGFTGEGSPQTVSETFSTVPPTAEQGYQDYQDFRRSSRGFGVVAFVRDIFDYTVDSWRSSTLSPLIVKLGLVGLLFVGGFIVLRIVTALVAGALGSFLGFLVHKAAGPMFMGFLAVGSTWGIHQTVANEYGMEWAAATVSVTAAIATLFALAGVRIRG